MTIIPELEPNDTLATAQFLDRADFSLTSNPNILNSTTIPHITVQGTTVFEPDHFSFTVNAGDRVAFDLDVTNFIIPGPTTLRLYDSEGNEILSNSGGHPEDEAITGLEAFIDYTFKSSGTYYIEPEGLIDYDLHISIEENVAPSIDPVLPLTLNENTSFSVDNPDGSKVINLTATDPNGETKFTDWKIVSGNDDDAFAIEYGTITVNDASALDFETNPTFTLGVTVSDGFATSEVQTITINLNDILDGSDRSERLRGTSEDDFVDALDGNDRVYGFNGYDTLLGGNGRDYLYGGNDDDFMSGDAQNDILSGQNGDDFLIGGSGNDRIRGGEGDDIIFGYEDNELIIEIEGDGGFIEDIEDIEEPGLYDNDRLIGDAGNDMLMGGMGIDRLIGGRDNDYLDGGMGIDYLYADHGQDSLVIRPGDGNDRIYSFDLSQDLLALDGLGAGDLSYRIAGRHTVISLTESEEVVATLIGLRTDGSDVQTTFAYYGGERD